MIMISKADIDVMAVGLLTFAVVNQDDSVLQVLWLDIVKIVPGILFTAQWNQNIKNLPHLLLYKPIFQILFINV